MKSKMRKARGAVLVLLAALLLLAACSGRRKPQPGSRRL